MDYDDLIEKWRSAAPGDESASHVEVVLRHYFGADSVKKAVRSSHQFRIKDARLTDLPGFGIGGHLTIPISGGQRVKKVYLKRIALAIAHIKQSEAER